MRITDDGITALRLICDSPAYADCHIERYCCAEDYCECDDPKYRPVDYCLAQGYVGEGEFQADMTVEIPVHARWTGDALEVIKA